MHKKNKEYNTYEKEADYSWSYRVSQITDDDKKDKKKKSFK